MAGKTIHFSSSTISFNSPLQKFRKILIPGSAENSGKNKQKQQVQFSRNKKRYRKILRVWYLNTLWINFPNYLIVNPFAEKVGKFGQQKCPNDGSRHPMHQRSKWFLDGSDCSYTKLMLRYLTSASGRSEMPLTHTGLCPSPLGTFSASR